MRIMVSAGEVSGDVHGSYLVKELKKLDPTISFFGIGSDRLASAGVDIKFDLTRRGTIGLLEALPSLLPVFFVFNRVKKLVLQERPDLVILIDSQGFNLPLAKFCKALGIKTVYYIAPQEWLWGTPRGVKKVAAFVDLVVAIFEKEYRAYQTAGADVVYFGHPLIDIVKPSLTRSAARKYFLGDDNESLVVALCPGSRAQEIKTLLPILLKAGEIVLRSLPQAFFLLPLSSPAFSSEINKSIRASSLAEAHLKIIRDHSSYDVLNASDLALCASGTINLESALLGIPNIMTYKLSALTYLIGKYILRVDKKIKYFSMPNILLDRKVIPELVMNDAEPEKIASAALSLLNDPAAREKMIAAFASLRPILGAPGVIAKCASSILLFAAKKK